MYLCVWLLAKIFKHLQEFYIFSNVTNTVKEYEYININDEIRNVCVWPLTKVFKHSQEHIM